MTHEEIVEHILPKQAFFKIDEVCKLKGICIKTAYNQKWLLPNNGKPDAIISGRKVFSYNLVADWLLKTDSEIRKGE
jgi:hypothetical protein